MRTHRWTKANGRRQERAGAAYRRGRTERKRRWESLLPVLSGVPGDQGTGSGPSPGSRQWCLDPRLLLAWHTPSSVLPAYPVGGRSSRPTCSVPPAVGPALPYPGLWGFTLQARAWLPVHLEDVTPFRQNSTACRYWLKGPEGSRKKFPRNQNNWSWRRIKLPLGWEGLSGQLGWGLGTSPRAPEGLGTRMRRWPLAWSPERAH